MALSLSPHGLQQEDYLWALRPPFPLSSFPRCSWGSEEEGEALDTWNGDDAMDRTEKKQLRLSPESVR